jgi:hypothetical protein
LNIGKKIKSIREAKGMIAKEVVSADVLDDEEKKIVFSLVDALVGKKKLQDALSNALKMAH